MKVPEGSVRLFGTSPRRGRLELWEGWAPGARARLRPQVPGSGGGVPVRRGHRSHLRGGRGGAGRRLGAVRGRLQPRPAPGRRRRRGRRCLPAGGSGSGGSTASSSSSSSSRHGQRHRHHHGHGHQHGHRHQHSRHRRRRAPAPRLGAGR